MRRHKRLRDGFGERLVPPQWPFTPEMQAEPARPEKNESPCDVWIQAASGGEAYLAWELLRLLKETSGLRVLCTTCTRQGLEVLRQAQSELADAGLAMTANYLPLDEPALMRRAVQQVFGQTFEPQTESPRLLVLLETEIWPGLLSACAQAGVRVLVLNGRMTESSFKAYKALGWLLRRYSPQGILATAKNDLERFCRVFDGGLPDNPPDTPDMLCRVGAAGQICRGLMNNIKFDRLASAAPEAQSLVFSPDGLPLIVLGSVRQEEEGQLLEVIRELFRLLPECSITLAPRHMHRVEVWSALLAGAGFEFEKRSEQDSVPLFNSGQVLIWDVFGQMPQLYQRATAVFIGGSLAPLGGQNFLEALAQGIRPVIGPHWKNFHWVGHEVIDEGLVEQIAGLGELGAKLTSLAESRLLSGRVEDRAKVRQTFLSWLETRTGGTAQAAALISHTLGLASSDEIYI